MRAGERILNTRCTDILPPDSFGLSMTSVVCCAKVVQAIRCVEIRSCGALLVNPDLLLLFFFQRNQLVTLAARYPVPTIHYARELADAGGLISYGASFAALYHQCGNYAGRILKGAKPADLPVEQAMKFELLINLKTAKALGLTLPPSLLFQADEVIQ